jgi:hypothetical protein
MNILLVLCFLFVLLARLPSIAPKVAGTRLCTSPSNGDAPSCCPCSIKGAPIINSNADNDLGTDSNTNAECPYIQLTPLIRLYMSFTLTPSFAVSIRHL